MAWAMGDVERRHPVEVCLAYGARVAALTIDWGRINQGRFLPRTRHGRGQPNANCDAEVRDKAYEANSARKARGALSAWENSAIRSPSHGTSYAAPLPHLSRSST